MDRQKHLALELALEDRLRADLGALTVRPYAYYKEAAMQRIAARPTAAGRLFSFVRIGATLAVAALLALGAALVVLNLRGAGPAATPTPNTTASTSASPSPSSTASPNPAPALTLHWMSFGAHTEPRYRLIYEGGSDVPFTEVRLLGRDGTVVAQAVAVPVAGEVMRMCSLAGPFGPTRATLALPTRELFNDVISRPDAYRVEARVAGEWRAAAAVVECHAME
jgi:hypothetical protein